MARTRNGNLIGMAAHNEHVDQQRALFDAQLKEMYEQDRRNMEFWDRFAEVRDRLQSLDPDGWSAWYDAQPVETAGEMLPIMEARVAELVERAR